MLVHRSTKRGAFTVAIAAVAALAVSALPAQAFSPRSETGVTSTTIKLGITVPLTGSAAPGYNKVPYGMKAYFDYVNDNGGVNGRKIQLVIKDDQYVPTSAKSATNDLILKDKVFAIVGSLGTANNEATTPFINSKKVPRLFVNTGFSGFANTKKFPTTYSLFPSYVMEAKVIGQYLADNFAGKKVALIYQDDDFGSDAISGFGTKTTFALKISYPSGQQSPALALDWISKIQEKGIDAVVVFGVSSATAYALDAAQNKGLDSKTQWILGSVGADPLTIGFVKANALKQLPNAVAASFMASPSDLDNPYIKQFREINTKYNKGASFDNNVLVGMNAGMLTVQALRAAGTNLTRANLMKAIETKGSTFASAGLSPISWSTSSHVGYNGYWFGKLAATGTMTPLDGVGNYVVYTTDSASGPVVKSTFKPIAMPTKGLPTN